MQVVRLVLSKGGASGASFFLPEFRESIITPPLDLATTLSNSPLDLATTPAPPYQGGELSNNIPEAPLLILGGMAESRGGILGGDQGVVIGYNIPQQLRLSKKATGSMGDTNDKIHNVQNLKETRKKLRNSLTPAEAKLWSLLKNSQLENRKFRRQHSVGPYVLDFYCPSEKLCIELDGAAHFTDGAYEYDTARTQYLRAHNIHVLRFENRDVFENTEDVLEEIRKNFIS